jgi:hypothetical protein
MLLCSLFCSTIPFRLMLTICNRNKSRVVMLLCSFCLYAFALLLVQIPRATAQLSLKTAPVLESSAWSMLGVTVRESTAERLVIEFIPQFTGFDSVRVGAYTQAQVLLRPRIKGTALHADRIGAPLYAELSLPLGVPSAQGFRIVETSVRSVKTLRGHILPLAKISKTVPDYETNTTVYKTATLPSWSDVAYNGIARNRHTATLRLRAARYNAANETIEIPQLVRVVLEFDPFQTPTASVESAPEQHFVRLLNASQASSWRVPMPSAPLSDLVNSTVENQNGKQSAQVQSDAITGALRIGTEREGMYRITAQQLRDAGLAVSASDVSTLRLFGNGGAELPQSVTAAATNAMNEQPLIVETDAAGSLTAITFYGAAPNGFVANGKVIRHFVNTYSKRNFYLLTVGGSVKGKRADFAESPARADVSPTWYTARTFKDDDIFNPYEEGTGQGSGRRWFGQSFSSGVKQRFETPLPNLVTNAGPIFYTMALAWSSPLGSDTDGGTMLVQESGQSVFPQAVRLPFSTYEYSVGTIVSQSGFVPATAITNNRSQLDFLYMSEDARGDVAGTLDWYEIHYPRSFVAVDNQLDFFAEAQRTGILVQNALRYTAEYTATGFTGTPYIVEVTNRADPQFVKNAAAAQGMATGTATFRTTIDTTASPKRFFVSAQTLGAASLEKADVANLRSTIADADLIVITDKDLLSSAQAYKTYRESTGMKVALVTTEQVYNEFNGGTPDVTALRDYIAHAVRTWTVKPRYVLLWGDAHYDYRMLAPNNTVKNFVPTYQIFETNDGDMNSVSTNYITEDFFVCVIGEDNIVDMALGRECIQSDAEGMTVLSKIRQYESTSSPDPWRTQVTVVADDGPTKSLANSDGTQHTGDAESIMPYIPADMRIKKIYLPDYPTENNPGARRRPGVTADLIATVNAGTLLLNWVGHGNPRVWSDENVLIRDETIPQFTNADRLFFLVAATCDFARFDMLGRQSGAEVMVNSSRGGAIGTFAAARTVYAQDNSYISQEFYRQIFIATNGGPSPRLGDLVFQTKQTRFTGLFENDRKFLLIGDPTVPLALPEQRVVVETLGGMAQTDTAMPEVKALSTITVTGRIDAPGNLGVDAGFTGNMVCSLYDTEIQKAVVDVDTYRTVHNFKTLGSLLNIGAGQVQNGRFSLRLPIPKDISFSNKPGQLFMYAVNANGTRFGRGATTRFTIGGVDETAFNDGIGPTINLFMTDRTFRAGDFADSTPRLIADLYDETGINATGTGIGHDIQCWIDNNVVPIVLTSSFRISLEDPRRGTVSRVLPKLAPGLHRVRVRAWDVFNNYSESETFFRISGDASSVVLTDVINYPNPFTETTRVRFRHNQDVGQPVTLSIFSTEGVRIRTIDLKTDARTMDVTWDGRNDSGTQVASGMYIVRVQLTGADGSMQAASGRMMRSR